GFVLLRRPVPVRRFEGWTRGGSPSCLAKCGGQGASAMPAASCSLDSSSRAPSDPTASSMPPDGSPFLRNRFGTVSIVNAAGSQPGTSSHVTGVDTRASSVGRTEYAETVVRSLAFWL